MVWCSNCTVAVVQSVSITQIVQSITFSGIPAGGPVNLINQISNTPFAMSNVWTWAAVGLPAVPTLTNVAYKAQTNFWIMNLEADDPRMNLLYTNNATGSYTNTATCNYNLGAMNVACSPNSSNTVATYPDTGPREGLASFYVKTNDYITIGEVGYVHRGEPWTTIRLQPGGEGNILEYIRVNELLDIAGRISVNSDVNGPLGRYQSPAFFALFSGLRNPVYGTITDDKITNIIAEIDSINSNYTGGAGIGYDIAGVGGGIKKFCQVTGFNSDLSGAQIAYTNDAAREEIIRDVSNLLSDRGGGTAHIIGWGQVIKGGSIPGIPVVIKANYSKMGGRIVLTSYQYYYYWQ